VRSLPKVGTQSYQTARAQAAVSTSHPLLRVRAHSRDDPADLLCARWLLDCSPHYQRLVPGLAVPFAAEAR
jgi:hypothetical protein